jgi:hypothetical protein
MRSIRAAEPIEKRGRSLSCSEEVMLRDVVPGIYGCQEICHLLIFGFREYWGWLPRICSGIPIRENVDSDGMESAGITGARDLHPDNVTNPCCF